MMGPLAGHDLVAFIGATDLATARDFYGAMLGLPLVSEDGFALVFDAHGTTLRVTKVESVAAAPYTVLGWSVADIAATLHELERTGVRLQHYEGLPQDEWASGAPRAAPRSPGSRIRTGIR